MGTVTVWITGAQPEDFLNLCAKEGLVLQRLACREPFTLEVRVAGYRLGRLRRLAERAQCTVQVRQRRGLAFFLWGLRRRYALLAGAALCLVLALAGGRVILTVDVTGNQTLTAEEIISQLRLCGVSVGTWGPGIPIRDVENRMMLAMDELSFFSLNLSGTRAEVIVREKGRTPPAQRDEELPTDVVSAADGIITHMEPWKGDPRYMEGDPVQKGDILITGNIRLDSPAHGHEIDLGTMLVHAEGRVLAKTWHTLTGRIDLAAPVKVYTGEEVTRYSLSLMGRRMKFYENSGVPYEKYDIITQFKSWTPVEGKTLPVVWQAETYRAYTVSQGAIDPAAAEALLRQRLLASLEAAMDEGEILETDFSVRREGERLTVTLVAQCTEQIGRLRAMDTEERVQPPAHSAPGVYPKDETDTKEQSP